MCSYQHNHLNVLTLSAFLLILFWCILSLQGGGCRQPPFVTTGLWREKVLGFRKNYLWGTELCRILHSHRFIWMLHSLYINIQCCCKKWFILCVMFDTQGLEYCEERYSQELNGTAFPMRAQATNTRLISCQTIEKFRHHPDRDDSMNEGVFACPKPYTLWSDWLTYFL